MALKERVLATKLGSGSLISKTHMAEAENQLLKVVIRPVCARIH